jgi:hypothetical protein
MGQHIFSQIWTIAGSKPAPLPGTRTLFTKSQLMQDGNRADLTPRKKTETMRWASVQSFKHSIFVPKIRATFAFEPIYNLLRGRPSSTWDNVPLNIGG